MIRVVRDAGDGEPAAEALLRTIDSQLDALTSRGRRLGVTAGEEALTSLRAMGEVPVGGALVTPAGSLPAAFLIHVVIRSREEAVSENGVRRAFRNALRQAAEWGVETLATPALGTGAGNLDAELSARIMMEVLREHRMESLFPRELVVLVDGAYEEDVFLHAADRHFSPGARPEAEPSG